MHFGLSYTRKHNFSSLKIDILERSFQDEGTQKLCFQCCQTFKKLDLIKQ